jgi:hypothetical protein
LIRIRGAANQPLPAANQSLVVDRAPAGAPIALAGS